MKHCMKIKILYLNKEIIVGGGRTNKNTYKREWKQQIILYCVSVERGVENIFILKI